jgi:EAL domain-containing protein (putative c-di-GMP-specific phosphodiesterase class I)/ActR/RegA family two-component response regulator
MRNPPGGTMTANLRILVIDDDSAVAEIIQHTAQAMRLPCVATSDASSFLAEITPDTTLLMLDLVMPGTDGIELLRVLGQQRCTTGIVLMSGLGKRILETAERLAASLGLNIVGHLQKPFSLSELEELLNKVFAAKPPLATSPRAFIRIPDEELVVAIEQDQFVLHYQPQLSIATNEVVGIEALVRWKHPQRGLIFPDNFIAQLEALGLIDRLGWLVADRGLAEMKQATGVDGELPILSLNISAYSLYDLKFTDLFVSRLRQHGIEAKKVTLEITESGLIKDLSNTLDVLTRLRMKHVQLSIDDFGTGYAMMQQLRLVPATELKIDRSFVQNMHLNDSDRVMVQKTIEIGHELSMKVVAEGVETLEQLDFLRANDCDTAQGYLFSRPLPVEQLVTWLKEHHAHELPSTPLQHSIRTGHCL